MNFIKPNLNSLPEQVDINTNDIKNLKSVLKASYKTEKELETTTITIPITDTNAPQDTTSGWLYDSVGHLFSINGGDNTNLLLEYYTSFRGPAGINGVAVVQTTGTSTESVMSQNAVTTELESKSNLDASNLSGENVTSWSNKLGIGTLTTELESKANLDASNLSSQNVTSWNNKLGIGALTTELESKANIDASNLSSENVTNWREKLSISGMALKEIINVTCSNQVTIASTPWVETPIIYDTISKHAGKNLLSYDNATGKIKIPANSGYSFVKITSNGAGQMTQTTTNTCWAMGIHETINETITNLSTLTIPYIPNNGGTATSPYSIINIADVDQDNDTYINAYFSNGYDANNKFVVGTNLTIECY